MNTADKTYRIVRLEAEDVLRLKAVTIEPSGQVVTLGGDNGQGKTSVLRCIEMALAGAGSIPRKPIRNGASKGRIVVDLGDLIVKRTFTEKGTALSVESKDGAKYPSPQSILDGLVGRLSFDPLAFKAMDPRDQRETLRKLVGLDFGSIEDKRRSAFDRRTDINRVVKQREARLAGRVKHEDAPETEVSVTALMDELKRREQVNATNEGVRNQYADAVEECSETEQSIIHLKRDIEELEGQLKIKRETLAMKEDELRQGGLSATALRANVDALVDANLDEVKTQIAGSQDQNRKVRENAALATEQAALKEDQTAAEKLTAEIEDCDRSKTELLAEAKWPIEGLAFDDAGVTLSGIPFEQLSEAEAIRVSCAMGLAMHPRLRVMLIRNAPYLDERTLELISRIAAENEAQFWLEQGGSGKACSVILSDGAVKEPEAEAVGAT